MNSYKKCMKFGPSKNYKNSGKMFAYQKVKGLGFSSEKTKAMRNAGNIYREIKKHFDKSNDTIGLYEERIGREVVFCFNIYKKDIITLKQLEAFNNPSIGPSKLF